LDIKRAFGRAKRMKKTTPLNHKNQLKGSGSDGARKADLIVKRKQNKQIVQKPGQTVRKIEKKSDKKGAGQGAVLSGLVTARQFLRESKTELKKVKWPTKKELMASTAVVIFLTLLMAIYFWLVDMGLIAIIRGILA
jgi:preprotein translocase subunit SecE